jgi:hypothetical protein
MTDDLYVLFALDEPSSDAVPAIASLVGRLNEERQWRHGDIEFVDDVDASSVTRSDDHPVRTLGGALTLTRPTDDPGAERSQLEDVEFVIERLCEFSGSSGHAFVVQYDGDEVGSIRNGRMDASLRDGLLAEWQKRVQGP